MSTTQRFSSVKYCYQCCHHQISGSRDKICIMNIFRLSSSAVNHLSLLAFIFGFPGFACPRSEAHIDTPACVVWTFTRTIVHTNVKALVCMFSPPKPHYCMFLVYNREIVWINIVGSLACVPEQIIILWDIAWSKNEEIIIMVIMFSSFTSSSPAYVRI